MAFRVPSSVRFFLVALTAILAAGCTTTPSSGTSPSPRDVIGAEEIRELGRLTAYQVVQRLHPQWLRPRGVDSFNSEYGVVVYLDGQRVGGVDALRRISAPNVEQIRRLDSRQATMQYGTGHPSGALLVTTRR